MSPEAAREELSRRADAIEGGYEMMLAYAAQGLATDQGAANSAHRVAAVGRRFALHADDLSGQRILLVDDLVVTGWTLTLAARAVRAAGAVEARPLVLAAGA